MLFSMGCAVGLVGAVVLGTGVAKSSAAKEHNIFCDWVFIGGEIVVAMI